MTNPPTVLPALKPGIGFYFFPKKVNKNSRLRLMLQSWCFINFIAAAPAKGEFSGH
jgi:hypothetical protein